MGFVAKIKRITNQTNLTLHIYNIEFKQFGAVSPNDSSDCDFGIPWVGNVKEFIERVNVFELDHKVRFYLWDSDWHLWNYRTYEKPFQGPFDQNTRILMKGNEWASGSLVSGEHSKDHEDKELLFRKEGNDYVLRVLNI